MSKNHLLAPYVRQFLLQDLIADRNLSLNTQRSYRDTIRLLLRFIHQNYSTDPIQVTAEQVTEGTTFIDQSPEWWESITIE